MQYEYAELESDIANLNPPRVVKRKILTLFRYQNAILFVLMILREFLTPRCAESKVTVHTLMRKKPGKKILFFHGEN